MNTIGTDDTIRDTGSGRRPGGLARRVAVEVVIGVCFAAILIAVAWASSNAIHFVYGGY